MVVRLSVPAGAILALFLTSAVWADNSQFGDLDFSRLSKLQEQFFWKRLKSLAFEEAAITYCGQPDDFETIAKRGIHACVTGDALNKADAFFRSELKMTLDSFSERRMACDAKPDSVRGWLGVDMRPVSKGIADGLGDNALDGSPAAAADIRAGDVITAVNGDYIAGPKELSAKIRALSPGTAVQLSILRDGAGHTVSAKLGAMAFDQLGRIEFDMPSLIESSKEDLRYVADQVTEMCRKCKTSIWAVFCH